MRALLVQSVSRFQSVQQNLKQKINNKKKLTHKRYNQQIPIQKLKKNKKQKQKSEKECPCLNVRKSKRERNIKMEKMYLIDTKQAGRLLVRPPKNSLSFTNISLFLIQLNFSYFLYFPKSLVSVVLSLYLFVYFILIFLRYILYLIYFKFLWTTTKYSLLMSKMFIMTVSYLYFLTYLQYFSLVSLYLQQECKGPVIGTFWFHWYRYF